MTTRQTADTSKTNFTHDFRGDAEECRAYREVLDYLVKTGRYPGVTEADNDARERVRFCEEINLYADDPRLKNASIQQRKIHALIHSNNLQAVITDNNGYLPIVDNSGVLPSTIKAGEGDSTASARSATDNGPVHNPLHTESRYTENDFIAAVVPDAKKATIKRVVAETAISQKENTFLQVVRYISKASLIVAAMLGSSVLFFRSDALLQVTKYTFFLFIVMMIAAIGLSEVSSRLMLRLRYAAGYLSLIASASLSGLLFLQQPWAESAFNLRGGLLGVLVNFIIERVVAIGPFWLGVFFAFVASVFLLTTWQAGRIIRDDFSSGR